MPAPEAHAEPLQVLAKILGSNLLRLHQETSERDFQKKLDFILQLYLVPMVSQHHARRWVRG